MGYYIDLESITIDAYKTKLESSYLPPSRLILKQNLEERFGYFKKIGIKNVNELQKLLKNKKKIADLSQIEFLPVEYLNILLRELNSILPKPKSNCRFYKYFKRYNSKAGESWN
jgi:hypothetical protein